MKRYLIAGIVLVLLAVFYRPLLRGMGNFLIVEDPKGEVDAIFVLSGNSLDRGQEAARLYQEGWGDRLICLGGETSSALELYGIYDRTCIMTQRVLREAGVPDRDIELLPEGTSTFEEFEAITELCQDRGYDRIMVVSSRFHTGRIDRFFRLPLYLEGVEMVLRGAAESDFRESEWWKSETGLIFLNNEYLKTLYYWLRY